MGASFLLPEGEGGPRSGSDEGLRSRRSDTVTPHPFAFPIASLPDAQALSRQERATSPTIASHPANPNDFPVFPFARPTRPALVPPSAMVPSSLRLGGSLGRRSEAAAGAEGAGRDGAHPDVEAEGVEYPTAKGRATARPIRQGVVAPAARGARTGSPANNRRDGPGASKTRRAERASFVETVLLFKTSGRRPGRSAHASHPAGRLSWPDASACVTAPLRTPVSLTLDLSPEGPQCPRPGKRSESPCPCR